MGIFRQKAKSRFAIWIVSKRTETWYKKRILTLSGNYLRATISFSCHKKASFMINKY